MKLSQLIQSKLTNLFLLLAFLLGVASFAGCDMGTYSKRLKENGGAKKTTPVESADKAESDQ